jgi:hypothetical protein
MRPHGAPCQTEAAEPLATPTRFRMPVPTVSFRPSGNSRRLIRPIGGGENIGYGRTSRPLNLTIQDNRLWQSSNSGTNGVFLLLCMTLMSF